MDNLIAARSQDRRPEDPLALTVNQDLHETLCLALLEGAARILHSHCGHQRRLAGFAHLSLSHARPAKRWISVEVVGDDPVADAPLVLVEEVGRDDLEIVVGGVRESTFAIAVA